MKKKVYTVAFFLIIFTTVITSVIFQGYKNVEDFKEAEEEIYFLEEILLSEKVDYENKDVLNSIIEKYTVILNARIDIDYQNGDTVYLNQKNDEIIYEETLKSNNNYIKNLTIYLYEDGISANYIKSVFSAIIISIIIALFFISRFVKDDEEIYDNLLIGIENNIVGKKAKLDLKRKDERTLKLERKFNQMNNKIYETMEESKELNIKLKSIISSMTDGILAIDNSGKIILSNSFSEYILNIDDETDNIDEMSLEYRDLLLELSRKDIEDDNSIDINFDYPISKKIKVIVNPIKYYMYSNKKLGCLFIFKDVTKMDKLQTIREDFVANVSHELKTPLTSVLGFIETLQSGALEDKEVSTRFINIIEEEVVRMNTLIDDLLFLSEIESENIDLELETIDINKLVDSIFISLDRKAESNNVILEKNIKEELLIYGNANYLRQLIVNLISNGIKYNNEGGYVCITCSSKEGFFYIDILDNGQGINKDEIGRAFERFYRADKSRSTKVEGTGLGLSIVKHIVSIFNGSLFIESSLDVGTLITIKLPQD